MDNPEVTKDLEDLFSGKTSFDAPAAEAMISWQKDEIQRLEDFFLNVSPPNLGANHKSSDSQL